MHRLALLLPVLAGCELFFEETDPDDGETSPTSDCGEVYTGTIFEPADGATVPTTFDVRVRWNQPDIPDRFTGMSDDFGNYFIPKDWEILGDGSTRDRYELPAGGHFNFDMGWYCDAANGGTEVVLAHVRVHTQ